MVRTYGPPCGGRCSAAFTDDRRYAMATGSPYADARCPVAYDDRGDAVATATVWSAGPGGPGTLEPRDVHPNRRGRGYGKARDRRQDA
ncbi:hypothetical protein [Streptomyces luteocolor]|uniref:hypothetical protein n=1 Tax=Streptomyces luteocolor TaxID=285500 RepID=UPI000853E050